MEANGPSLPDCQYVPTDPDTIKAMGLHQWTAWFSTLLPPEQQQHIQAWQQSQVRAARKRHTTAVAQADEVYHTAFGRTERYYQSDQLADLATLAAAYCQSVGPEDVSHAMSQFTKTRPTEPGWYWFKFYGDPIVCEIVQDKDGLSIIYPEVSGPDRDYIKVIETETYRNGSADILFGPRIPIPA